VTIVAEPADWMWSVMVVSVVVSIVVSDRSDWLTTQRTESADSLDHPRSETSIT